MSLPTMTNLRKDICPASRTSEVEQVKYLQGATKISLGEGPLGHHLMMSELFPALGDALT